MLDDFFTIIISFSLACVEVSIFMIIGALCGITATTFWLALIVYAFIRNAYILHRYAAWF